MMIFKNNYEIIGYIYILLLSFVNNIKFFVKKLINQNILVFKILYLFKLQFIGINIYFQII